MKNQASSKGKKPIKRKRRGFITNGMSREERWKLSSRRQDASVKCPYAADFLPARLSSIDGLDKEKQ